jgi:hypothetical protein
MAIPSKTLKVATHRFTIKYDFLLFVIFIT